MAPGKAELHFSAYNADASFEVSPKGSMFTLHRKVSHRVSHRMFASHKGGHNLEVGSFLQYSMSADWLLHGGLSVEFTGD